MANLDSPEKSLGIKEFEGTYEVLIMDGFGREGEGTGRSYSDHIMRSYEQFENEISQLVLIGVGILDVKSLMEWAEKDCRDRGDFDVDYRTGGGGGEGGVAREIERAVKALENFNELGNGIENGGLNGAVSSVGGIVSASGSGGGGKLKKKEKVVESNGLEALRDDALAFKLSRSLFN